MRATGCGGVTVVCFATTCCRFAPLAASSGRASLFLAYTLRAVSWVPLHSLVISTLGVREQGCLTDDGHEAPVRHAHGRRQPIAVVHLEVRAVPRQHHVIRRLVRRRDDELPRVAGVGGGGVRRTTTPAPLSHGSKGGTGDHGAGAIIDTNHHTKWTQQYHI